MANKLFVEIGACDFDTCIPLLKNGWSGVFVEAVPKYAQSLVEQTEEYVFCKVINKVITTYDGVIDFAIANGEDWQRGISHVMSDNHTGEKLLTIEKNQRFLDRVVSLPCMTLDTLLIENEISNIDFLKLDIEGHEADVLYSYSWKVKPSIIKLEHSHIDDVKMRTFLESLGYMVYVERSDIYGII